MEKKTTILLFKIIQMDHILNINAVMKKMKNKPQGQRPYHFFLGITDRLSVEDIKEIRKIVNREHKKMVKFLDGAIIENKDAQKKIA